MSRPNILFILSDQHRPDAMGCAGHPFVQTPRLDALAARGMRFTHAYSPNPLCTPARMALMTGQNSERIRVFGNGNVLDTTIPTFAHGMGAAGYEAVLCGKMHFCGPDQYHGFEKRMVGDPESELLDPKYRLSPKGDQWVADKAYPVTHSGPGRQGFQYFDREVARAGAEFIANRKEGDRPWMLVAGFIAPHNPYVCEPHWYEKYRPLVTAPTKEDIADRAAAQPYLAHYGEAMESATLTDEDHMRARAAYYGLCSELDANIGTVLDALESSGQLENTIIIYTSDHGDMCGDGALWYKKCLTESSAGVPFIVAGPGVAQGVVNEANISLLDLAPTMLAMAGGPPLPRTDGVNLVPTLANAGRTPHAEDVVWSESLGIEGCRHLFALWEGRWKYVYVPEFGHEHLFNLTDDPEEKNDLARHTDTQERMVRMRTLRDERWSYESNKATLTDYNTRIKYLRGCGHPFFPEEAPTLAASPEWCDYEKPE